MITMNKRARYLLLIWSAVIAGMIVLSCLQK